MWSTRTAIQNVRQSAVDGNTPGFMLAFTIGKNLGFGFLARGIDFSAALYCVQDRQSSPEYTCIFQGGADSDYAFVREEYLQTAAKNMQADYGQLITHFAQRMSEWRFESWRDGKPYPSLDNDLVWRTRLWPVVLRIADTPPRCMEAVPSSTRGILLGQLRGHAVEGMIVLDK